MRLFAAALAAMVLTAPVAAQTVMSVARAKVVLPAGEWVVLPKAVSEGLKVEGHAGVEGERQTAVLIQSGAVRAWVEVNATPRTYGFPLALSNDCRASSATRWSVAVEEGNPLDRQCVSASAPFGAARTLEARPTLGELARERGLALPHQLVFMSAHMVRTMGLLMDISVFAEPSFVGDNYNLPLNMPQLISARHGAYALQLMALVRDCLYSVRCAGDLPALVFTEAAVQGK
jgi:hypothetical protein